MSRDVWQWCVAEGFSARWLPEAAPRLDKYIVEFNIPTFFRGYIGQRYAKKGARTIQKPGTEFFEYQEQNLSKEDGPLFENFKHCVNMRINEESAE